MTLRSSPATLLLSGALMLCVGCQQTSMIGTPVKGTPDGPVEVLRVAEFGEMEHDAGEFLKLVDRSDHKLVLVDFWATWCGPCRMLAPHLESIKKEWGDNLEVVKVDIDQARATAIHLNVSSIPDVRIYRNGTQVGGFEGVIPEQEIQALLKSLQ